MLKSITYVLSSYYKTWNDVTCVVGDNVSVNRSIANEVRVPLIECASQPLNLALCNKISTEEELVHKIHQLMVKLRTLLLSAKLRVLTTIRPNNRSITRWSSTYEMVQMHIRLREFFPLLNSIPIDTLPLPTPENRRVDCFLKQLATLNSVTKTLQYDTTTLSDVRALFDAATEEFPETH